MGFLQPQQQEATNQATGLSEDVLAAFQQLISQGRLGQSVGPLGREAGTAARQFVSPGGGQFDLSPEIAQLETLFERRKGRASGDLSESLGIVGSGPKGAFSGTPLATGQAQLGEGLEAQFAAQIGELLRQSFESRQGRLLQGIDLLSLMEGRNLAPFLQLGGQGVVTGPFAPSPFVQGAQSLAGLAQGVGSFV